MTKARNIANLASDGSALADGTINYTDVSGTPTLATVATSGAYADVTGTPTLAAVATTGAYADVTGTPAAALPLTGGTLSGGLTVTSGDVGIGTSSPATKLEVASPASTAAVLRISSNKTGTGAGDKSRLEFYSADNSGTAYETGYMVYDRADTTGTASYVAWANRVADTVAERMRISPSGGLSVGTTADAGAGGIFATGNVTAYYSDDQLKTKLGSIDDAVSKVQALSGFYYEANQTAQDLGYVAKREVGVSAQEVQAIMPEVVSPAPIDAKYLTVDYARLVPLLIEAIKELKQEIETLKGN